MLIKFILNQMTVKGFKKPCRVLLPVLFPSNLFGSATFLLLMHTNYWEICIVLIARKVDKLQPHTQSAT